MRLRAQGCVYCGRDGPYNDEHVIPAGLGAGNAMLLQGLVCKPCNDDFSKLEVRVLRRGDIGLGRLALQEHGRDRGAKTRAPTFEASSAKLMTEDGRALEIGLGHRLAVEILPQVTQRGEFLEGGGSDRSRVERFLLRLDELLTATVSLVAKRSSAAESHTLTPLQLGPTGYVVTGAQSLKKPGADVIWLEAPESDIPGSYPRVLERSRSSIAVQVAEADAAAAATFLTLVKANLPNLKTALSTTIREVDIDQPPVHVIAHAPFEDEVARLIAKIGFNLLVFDQGEALARHTRFDALCAAVCKGEPELPMRVWSDTEGILPKLRKIFAQRHWMMLAPLPNPAGGLGLAFGCSLYGGAARLVLLADEIPPGFENAHAFFAVNYQAHTVQRFNLAQVLTKIRAVVSEEAVGPGESAEGNGV